MVMKVYNKITIIFQLIQLYCRLKNVIAQGEASYDMIILYAIKNDIALSKMQYYYKELRWFWHHVMNC